MSDIFICARLLYRERNISGWIWAKLATFYLILLTLSSLLRIESFQYFPSDYRETHWLIGCVAWVRFANFRVCSSQRTARQICHWLSFYSRWQREYYNFKYGTGLVCFIASIIVNYFCRMESRLHAWFIYGVLNDEVVFLNENLG